MEQWLHLPAFASRVSIPGWSSIGNKSRWMVEHLGNLDGVLYGDCHQLAILKHGKFPIQLYFRGTLSAFLLRTEYCLYFATLIFLDMIASSS
jgi:hypothetical protein